MTRFWRHPVEDHHPSPDTPAKGTDRITWGRLFGVTYQEALADTAWCQLCISQAEDPEERRPWNLRFAQFAVKHEGQAALNLPNPTPQENAWEEVRPEDSVSMLSAPASASMANTARTRSHAGKRR